MARKPPSLGRRLATLNLFREPDGSLWLTVADGRVAVDEANGRQPMALIADWIAEAGPRFVETWKDTAK